jgi:hypothetical protein
MSRSNNYTKKFSSGNWGGPVGEFVKEIDVATMGATEEVNICDEFSWAAQLVSCQVVSEGLTGTLDGAVDLQQSNDGKNYDLLGIQTSLTSADESNTLQKADWSGKYLGALITKNGLTGGTLKLYFIVKHH